MFYHAVILLLIKTWRKILAIDPTTPLASWLDILTSSLLTPSLPGEEETGRVCEHEVCNLRGHQICCHGNQDHREQQLLFTYRNVLTVSFNSISNFQDDGSNSHILLCQYFGVHFACSYAICFCAKSVISIQVQMKNKFNQNNDCSTVAFFKICHFSFKYSWLF